ncbi:hypothetical protein IMF27_16775 [Pseudomonas sp. PCH199]|uniref:hypothetical protein n=1 Tax=unclassified Pseudomonas TaxID=196821 RepID=UPI000BDB7681|nr:MULTISPECIES: hypothetical protein [unclassified Pseudomonas]MCW8277123.1 hypothetical protein [Pseudomonas sp. PCH199]PAM82616.1 hypothetical protein CES87_17115 [Pseudomonas sp. ERMR1:02]
MNDAIEQESDVSREIEALRAILSSGAMGAPALTAYLEAALAALESGGALPQAMSLTSEANSRNDRPKKARKTKSLGSLDSLGGGNIV